MLPMCQLNDDFVDKRKCYHIDELHKLYIKVSRQCQATKILKFMRFIVGFSEVLGELSGYSLA